jgi:hypothetical protein
VRNIPDCYPLQPLSLQRTLRNELTPGIPASSVTPRPQPLSRFTYVRPFYSELYRGQAVAMFIFPELV